MPHPVRAATPAPPSAGVRDDGTRLRIADSRKAIGQSRRLIVRSKALIEQTKVHLGTLPDCGE